MGLKPSLPELQAFCIFDTVFLDWWCFHAAIFMQTPFLKKYNDKEIADNSKQGVVEGLTHGWLWQAGRGEWRITPESSTGFIL